MMESKNKNNLSLKITFLKSVHLAVTNLISPKKRVVKTKINGKIINEGEMKEASSYIAVYIMFIAISWIIITYFTNDPLYSLFDVTSTIGNVGLSTGMVSGSLNPIGKILLIFLMWIGRLEIIPVLLTFTFGLNTVEHGLKVIKKSIRNKWRKITA